MPRPKLLALTVAFCAATALATPGVAAAQPEFTPAVTVTPDTGLDPDGAVVTIKGTGFDPDGNDGRGYGLRIGPELDTLKDPGTTNGYQFTGLIKKDAVGRQIPLSEDGSWEITAKVKAAYKGSDGRHHDAATEPFRVYTFGWRSDATTWDVVVPITFTGQGEPPDETPGAGLYWGFKQSWRDYVHRFGGTAILSGGAVADDDPKWTDPRPYVWPVRAADYDPATGKGTVTLGGAVHYAVPSHLIWDLGIASPKITLTGPGTGTLTATINYAQYGTKENPDKVQPPVEVELADLTLATQPERDHVRISITSTTLTEEAAAAFDGFYQAGEALDAGALVFAGTPGEPGYDPKLALPNDTVARGGTLAVDGAGFAPGEAVSLASPAGNATTKADGSGAFRATVAVPGDASLGAHTLTATGAESGKPVTAGFTVTGEPSACALEPGEIAKADLVWGLKKSFRKYVGTKQGNSITAGGGAEITSVDEVVQGGVANPAGIPTGAHRYALASGTFTSPTEFSVRYKGTVTFAYPAHSFTLTVANPKIVVSGTSGTLSADIKLDVTQGAPQGPVDKRGIELATLDLAGAKRTDRPGAFGLDGITATLTSADAFGGFYQAGDRLDDVSLAIGAACANLPGGGSGPSSGQSAGGQDLVPPVNFRPRDLASTGSPVLVLTAAALALLLSGAWLLTFGRRQPLHP